VVLPAALAVAIVTLLVSTAGATGPIQVDSTLEQYFRLQWETTPAAGEPRVAGYVENLSALPVDRMRLLVERLDAGGAVTGASTTWVMGVVVPHHRTYFTTRVPAASAYRVRILTFDWSNCRD
jgi:hypothetical protein